MAMLCLGVTSAFVLPINIHLFFHKRKENFLLSLVSTAMAFYLFSFQVSNNSKLSESFDNCKFPCFFQILIGSRKVYTSCRCPRIMFI